MEATFNNDSFFFEIKSDDLEVEKSLTKIISEDAISLSITEEIGNLTTGSLSVLDKSHDYSRIIRNGMKIDISWGYKKFSPLRGLTSSIRTGMKCVVQKPSGSSDESGKTLYNATFYGLEFLNGKQHRQFDTGKRADVISQLMNDLDVDKVFINFEDQNSKVDTENPVVQSESSFSMIGRLAQKWGAIFHLGYMPSGKKAALFVSTSKVKSEPTKNFISSIVGISNRQKDLYYKDGSNSNVRSYTWEQHIGESGQGSNVNVQYINGKVVFIRRIAETRKVVTYRINPAKIQEKYKTKNIKETLALTKNLMSKTEFEEIQWAFDSVEEETAPEGLGFSINVEMLGDPKLTVPLDVRFVRGFPSVFAEANNPLDANKKNEYFVNRTVHKISKAGYFTSLKIVDSFAVNGTSIVQRKNIE